MCIGLQLAILRNAMLKMVPLILYLNPNVFSPLIHNKHWFLLRNIMELLAWHSCNNLWYESDYNKQSLAQKNS